MNQREFRGYRRLRTVLIIAACCGVILSCGGNSSSPPQTPSLQYSFDFANGAQDWVGGSAEYPVSFESQMEIHTEIRYLPYPLDQTRIAFYIGGRNDSDDLYLFLKRHVTGLKPNQSYAFTYTVTFGTHDGDVGVIMGVQGGATPTEPNRIVEQRSGYPYYVMNVSKGVPVGISTKPHPDSPDWELKTVKSTTPWNAESDANGAIWLLVGADSNWESWSELYITRIKVEAREN